jgi:hypothetical protein
MDNIAEIKPPPRIIDNSYIIKRVEEELHYIAMRDNTILPKLIKKDEEKKQEVLDVWGEIDDDLKFGRKVAEKLLTPKNVERLNTHFWAHLEEEKNKFKTAQDMPVISDEYERVMKEARHTIEFDYNSLNITEKLEIQKLVKIPRVEWTLEKRTEIKNKILGKEMGVTWLNMVDHLDFIRKAMPSLLTKDDVTFTPIPHLYVRDVRTIY